MNLDRLVRLALQSTWSDAVIVERRHALEDAVLQVAESPEGRLMFELLEESYLYRVSKDQLEEGQRSVLLGLYQIMISALKRRAEEEAATSGRQSRVQTHATMENTDA